MFPEHRRLTPSERLWLAVLDQACMDYGARRRGVREEARRWWRSEMPGVIARACGVPVSRLAALRERRGGLRTSLKERRGHHRPAAWAAGLEYPAPLPAVDDVA